MNVKIYTVSTLFIVAGVVLLGCTGNVKTDLPVQHQKTANETVTVTKKSIGDIKLAIFTVSMQPLTSELIAPAKILPNQNLESQVGSPVQGRVQRIFVNLGDAVAAGQVLMLVGGPDVGAMKANFVKAKAAHEYAKAALERQKKLFDEKACSQKSLLETQAEYEKAFAEYTAEDKKIHSVGLTDADVATGNEGDEHTAGTLPIKSHISGVVVERNVVVGQYVDATTNAFKVIDSKTVWIDGQVYEKDLAKIDHNTDVVFTTSTYPGDIFTGRIINIGQMVDDQSRTITIRSEFANPKNKLKPHMFGELKIPIGAKKKALLVPEDAVVAESALSYVFVQTNDTTFEKRTVVTGISVNAMIEVKDGLKVHEKIASKGVYYLKGDLKKEELSGDEN